MLSIKNAMELPKYSKTLHFRMRQAPMRESFMGEHIANITA